MPSSVNVRVTRFGRPLLSGILAQGEEDGLVVASRQKPRLVKGAVYAVSCQPEDGVPPHPTAYTFAGRRGENYYFE